MESKSSHSYTSQDVEKMLKAKGVADYESLVALITKSANDKKEQKFTLPNSADDIIFHIIH